MCGTGIGMSIAANRNRGIRAAACASAEAARLAREHNDANVLCLGRRILSLKTCIELLDVFLNTPFSGGERHKRRVGKMG
jgi:ribose 5-phosphate isomerase B